LFHAYLMNRRKVILTSYKQRNRMAGPWVNLFRFFGMKQYHDLLKSILEHGLLRLTAKPTIVRRKVLDICGHSD